MKRPALIMDGKLPNPGFEFRIRWGDGRRFEYGIELDYNTWTPVAPPKKSRQPAWTRLSHKQCAHCPLRGPERCPAAVPLVPVVEAIRKERSGAPATTEIRSLDGRRRYRLRGGLSEVFGPLVKLLLTTSGCPILDRLRPAIRLGAPLATPDQLTRAILAGGLLGEFARTGGSTTEPAFKAALRVLIDDADAAVAGLLERVRSLNPKDAVVNALLGLHAALSTARMALDHGLAAAFPDCAPGAPPASRGKRAGD